MSNFFNINNPIMRFLSIFCDLILLNILFIISCLPIFTIGSAISSLYYITLQMINGDDPYIFKGYWKAFRNNFKQATCIWIPVCIAIAFFCFEIYLIYNVIDPVYTILQYPILIIMFAILSIIIYAFPLLACFKNTTKQLLKNSILLSIGNIPTTIFITVLHIAIITIASISGKAFVTVFSIAIFFGFSGVAYFCSLFLNQIFKKHQPTEKKLEE